MGHRHVASGLVLGSFLLGVDVHALALGGDVVRQWLIAIVNFESFAECCNPGTARFPLGGAHDVGGCGAESTCELVKLADGWSGAFAPEDDPSPVQTDA